MSAPGWRVLAGFGLVCGLGCRAEHRVEPRKSTTEQTVDPLPVNEPRRTLAIEFRLQPSAKDLPNLRLDPAGVWVVAGCAEPSIPELGVWEFGSGDYVGRFEVKAAWPGIADCGSWPTLALVDSDQEWAELSLDKRRRAKLSVDRTTLELYEGEGLAPKQRIAIPVDEDRGELLDGFAIWGPERVLVVRECAHARGCFEDCEADHSYEIWSWSPSERLKLLDTLNWDVDRERDEYQHVEAWYLSDDRRWLFAAVVDNPWSGSVAEFELGQGSTGIDSVRDDTDTSDGYREKGEWISGITTTWVTTPDVHPWELGEYEVGWAATRVAPSFASGSGVILDHVAGSPKTMDWISVGFEDGRLIHSWALCWAEAPIDEGLESRARVLDSHCVGERPTGACELLAAGPGGHELLAQCPDGVRVGPAGTTANELTAGQISGFVWTRAGLIFATEDGLWRLDGKRAARVPGFSQGSPVRIIDARLASEAGLVLLEAHGQLVILDAALGSQIMELGAMDIVDAAFAPNGERLAVATSNEVLIYTRGANEPALGFRVDDLGGVAWRQDGAALLTGATKRKPDRLWSLDEQPTELPVGASYFSWLEGTSWTLDPSWRFAADTDGSFRRTLDMLELARVDDAVFTDNGLFDGPAEDLDDSRLVFVEHPEWGAYRFAELAGLAHHPNLAADFFAGVSLPSPPTPSKPPASD